MTKHKKTLAGLILAAMLLGGALFIGCNAEPNQEQPQPPAEEPAAEETTTEAPVEPKGPFMEFTAEDLDGNLVTEEVFADYDLTIINIWGTFCTPCIMEMPELGEIADEYAEKGVQLMGIVGDVMDMDGQVLEETVAEAKSIVEDTKADYLHVLPVGELFTNVMPQISGFPTTVFVDSEGKQVGYAYVGARNKESWMKLIDEALEEVQKDPTAE